MDLDARIRDSHGRRPGASSRAYGDARGPDGLSGYEALAELIRPDEHRRVLDLACGDGKLIEVLQERREFLEISGVDRSDEELAAARNRLGAEADLRRADAAALPFEDGHFDAALCHASLLLLEPGTAVRAELRRILRPGGLVGALIQGSDPHDSTGILVFSMVAQLALTEGIPLRPPHPDWPAPHELFTAFPEPDWTLLDTQQLTLERRVPLSELGRLLRDAYYVVDFLSEAGRRGVELHVEKLAGIIAPEGQVCWRFPMHLFAFERG